MSHVTWQNLELFCLLVSNVLWSALKSKHKPFTKISIYRTRAIITRGLYIFYPIFEDHFFVFKEVFQKILPLCMVSIQERFLIKSGL